MDRDPTAYYKYYIKKGKQYAEDVRSGKILANKYIKQAVERYYADLERKDLYIDYKKLSKVFKFFSLMKVNHHNRYIQFPLLPYQVFYLINVFGFYWVQSKKRRYQTSFLFVSRKSGKTTFSVALQLYMLVADGQVDAQSLLVANSREQATTALNYAKGIVQNSPLLAKHLQVMQYQILFKTKTSSSIMKTVPAVGSRLDGYSPTGVILDEIHAYQDDSLYGVMKSGVVNRDNPLINIITTAGFLNDGFLTDFLQMAKNVLNKDVKDDSLFILLYTLDDDDDFSDTNLWIKSNPALGEIVPLEALKIQYQQATNRQIELQNFLTKNLNIMVDEISDWIEPSVLDACFVDNISLTDLYGSIAHMAIDLSSTRDLSSVSLLIEKDGQYYNYTHFFFPSNNQKMIRKGGYHLQHWIDLNYITKCETKTLDFDLVMDFITDLSEHFNIQECYYDPFNSSSMVPQIEALGIDAIKFPQTALNFNEPVKTLERYIYDNKIIFLQNPVLKWNFGNVVLYQDGNGNVKFLKNKSKDAIDGAVTTAMTFKSMIENDLSDLYDYYSKNL